MKLVLVAIGAALAWLAIVTWDRQFHRDLERRLRYVEGLGI